MTVQGMPPPGHPGHIPPSWRVEQEQGGVMASFGNQPTSFAQVPQVDLSRGQLQPGQSEIGLF